MNEIKDYNSFSQALFKLRDNDKKITYKESIELHKIIEAMLDKGHAEHSLMLLKKQIEEFGDEETKKNLGYGANIDPKYIVQVIPESKDFFNGIKSINTNTFINDKEKRLENIKYIKQAIIYYQKIINEQKSANSKEKMILNELKIFIKNND